MSILLTGLALSAMQTASRGDWVDAIALVLLLVFVLASLVLMTVLRVGSARRIDGSLRLPLDEPAAPLALTMLIAAFTWFGAQVIYSSFKQVAWMRQGHGAPMTMADYTPRDFALLSTIPGVIGFFCLLVGDLLSGPHILRRLGFAAAKVPRGIAVGLLGLFIIWPLVFWAMKLSELAYQRLHYQHPMEHDLLKNMGQTHNPAVSLGLMIGAAVVAPFFEEYLFRAHLQTLLKRAFIQLSQRRSRQRVWADGGSAALALLPTLGSGASLPMPAPPLPEFPPSMTTYPPAPEHYGTLGESPSVIEPPPPLSTAEQPPAGSPDRPGIDRPFYAWQTWLAVLITALLFAGIHPTWTIPGIFVLAVGLGYVYERTGNLWACITIHLLFNSISTAQYLYFMQHG